MKGSKSESYINCQTKSTIKYLGKPSNQLSDSCEGMNWHLTFHSKQTLTFVFHLQEVMVVSGVLNVSSFVTLSRSFGKI